MIPIPPIVLKLGTYVLVLGTVWTHGCHYGKGLGEVELIRTKTEYQAFTDKTSAAGEAAQKQADAQKALDGQRKAASDASYATALGVLGRDIGELRRARASTNNLPATPAASRCPDGWACFDRAELEQAIRRFDDGVSGIAEEGDQVRLQLTTAIDWAKAR